MQMCTMLSHFLGCQNWAATRKLNPGPKEPKMQEIMQKNPNQAEDIYPFLSILRTLKNSILRNSQKKMRI